VGIGDLDILPRMTSANAPSLRDALIVAAVAALLIVSPLGRHLIAYSGEARMALLARDMIERRVLFQAHVEGQLYRNKPPLYPWSIALASLPGGRVTGGHGASAGRHCRHRDGGRDLSPRGPALRAPRRPLGRSHADRPAPRSSAIARCCCPTCWWRRSPPPAAYAFWRYVSAPPGRLALAAFYTAIAFAVFSKGRLACCRCSPPPSGS
jgi:hypothetical protein